MWWVILTTIVLSIVTVKIVESHDNKGYMSGMATAFVTFIALAINITMWITFALTSWLGT